MKTDKMRVIEYERGKSIEAILRAAFERGLTDEEIAADLGITRVSLYDWLDRLGARVTRSRSVTFAGELTVA